MCEWIQCQKCVFYFTENIKEEPKHKDPVTKTQSFRQNRMKVSAPIPTVEDIATIKHKKKVCLHRHWAKNWGISWQFIQPFKHTCTCTYTVCMILLKIIVVKILKKKVKF